MNVSYKKRSNVSYGPRSDNPKRQVIVTYRIPNDRLVLRFHVRQTIGSNIYCALYKKIVIIYTQAYNTTIWVRMRRVHVDRQMSDFNGLRKALKLIPGT
jgi:hypothetical protein